MPILPLTYFDPFYATMGVMLYPDDELLARGWIVRRLASQAAPRLSSGEYVAPILLSEIASFANTELGDAQERYWLGTAVGELFKSCGYRISRPRVDVMEAAEDVR